MRYFWDYIVLVLSILGSIASIIGICINGDIKFIVAIVVLGFLLLISMIHDWHFTYKYRIESCFRGVFAEINSANSLIKDDEITNIQGATDLLSTYCESISTIFSKIKGHRIGVCVKLLVAEGGSANLISQARDIYSKSHNRKTGSSDETKHSLELNSDFSFIYNNTDSDLNNSSFFHSPDLANESDYRNSRLKDWTCPKMPFLPKSFVRGIKWPLPYRSTIVVPIWRLDSDFHTKENLRGFLCIDSPKTKAFNKSVDVEILRGFSDKIAPIIDKLIILIKG